MIFKIVITVIEDTWGVGVCVFLKRKFRQDHIHVTNSYHRTYLRIFVKIYLT